MAQHLVHLLTKILYASPAWWGFTTTSDKQRIEAFVRRGVGLSLYGEWSHSDPIRRGRRRTQFKISGTTSIMSCDSSFPTRTATASLRPRRHNFTLSTKTDDHNFITRQSFAYSSVFCCFFFSFLAFTVCRRKSVCLSEVRAPYSAGSNFWQCFYAIW